jgi:type VI secretion system FHA domain protein
MILTLEVTGPQASTLGAARRKVFGIEGGSIGRLPDNDWVLADPFVSGRHAIIRFMDGGFYIEDTSRNGVFVNSADERIVRGRPHLLASGDRILIDPYEIEAQVSGESMKPAGSSVGSSVAGPRSGDNPFESIEASFPQSSLAPVPAESATGTRAEFGEARGAERTKRTRARGWLAAVVALLTARGRTRTGIETRIDSVELAGLERLHRTRRPQSASIAAVFGSTGTGALARHTLRARQRRHRGTAPCGGCCGRPCHAGDGE